MFPWNSEASTEVAKSGRQNRQQPQASSTCPWGDAGSERSSSRGRRPNANSSGAKSTCPWSDSGGADFDSASLVRGERLRQKPTVGYQGAAGTGAPRVPSREKNGYNQSDAFPAQRDLPPRAPSRERTGIAQRDLPPRAPSYDVNDAAPAERDASGEPVASEMACDPDAQERADLIEMCLTRGLSDEQIEGVLREHMFQKMVEQEEKERASPIPVAPAAPKAAPARYQAPSAAQAPPASSFVSRLIGNSQDKLSSEYQRELAKAQQEAPPPECSFQPKKPSSVAAKRQAKAALSKSVSFGPSDAEIVGILEERRTPTPQMDDDACNTFLQNQQRAAAAKNRNRGQGIF